MGINIICKNLWSDSDVHPRCRTGLLSWLSACQGWITVCASPVHMCARARVYLCQITRVICRTSEYFKQVSLPCVYWRDLCLLGYGGGSGEECGIDTCFKKIPDNFINCVPLHYKLLKSLEHDVLSMTNQQSN